MKKIEGFLAEEKDKLMVNELAGFIVMYEKYYGNDNSKQARLLAEVIYAVSRNVYEHSISKSKTKNKNFQVTIVGKYNNKRYKLEFSPKFKLGAKFEHITELEATKYNAFDPTKYN